jgi:hypothetical protein
MVAVSNNIPSLFSVDVSTGQRTLIKSPLGDGTFINAIGYNALDNILYGVVNKSPPKIVQIGSTGTVTVGRNLPVSPGAWIVGDVDENGHFWIAYAGLSWNQIDLATMQTLASGVATLPISVYDWAYVPGGGNNLYGISIDSVGERS